MSAPASQYDALDLLSATTLLLSLTACHNVTPSPAPPRDEAPLTTRTGLDVEAIASLAPEAALVLTFEVSDTNGMLTLQTGDATQDYAIDWDNDGRWDATHLHDTATHSFGTSGAYTIRLAGRITHLTLCSRRAAERATPERDTPLPLPGQTLLDVVQWGKLPWRSTRDMFAHCAALESWSAPDLPDLSQVTDASYMFFGARRFEQPLDGLNVSQVTTMKAMFFNASTFNQPLEGWDVSQVTDMSFMFYDANRFAQELSAWDVSQVTTMRSMFHEAERFNKPLHTWDTSRVIDMSHMFDEAERFDQPLDAWNVSRVTDMTAMFHEARRFDQPLQAWDVSQVRSMRSMFDEAEAFNQPLNRWNTSRVVDMTAMFHEARRFDQPLDAWNVGGVKEMDKLFDESALSAANYDATLAGWAAREALQRGVRLGAREVRYCEGGPARQRLIDAHGWTITGDTLACE